MGVKLNVKFEKTVGQFHIFDWDAPKLQEWSIKAQEMQNVHCNENNGTKSFDYDDTESDAIQLRVCQSLFGLRHTSPEAEKKGLPKGTIFSFLRAYSWIERKRARKFQKKIVQYGKNNDGKFVFNLVFVSSAFPDGKGGFNASENAVFVLGESQNVYLDAGCRKYDSWEDYQLENTLPNGVMLYPKDGNYTPKPDNVVILNARETPACTPSAKAKEFIDQVVMVGGLLLTGAVVVSMLPFTLFSAATMAAISTGSFYIGGALTTYSAAMGIYDKIQHDESIMTEMFMVATVACSALSQVVSRSWADQFGKNIANGESWSNVVKGISKTQRTIFITQNMLKIGLSASSVFRSMYVLWMKKYRSWSDWCNLSISFFFFANAIVKPVTLQGLFESEQGKYMQKQLELKTEEIQITVVEKEKEIHHIKDFVKDNLPKFLDYIKENIKNNKEEILAVLLPILKNMIQPSTKETKNAKQLIENEDIAGVEELVTKVFGEKMKESNSNTQQEQTEEIQDHAERTKADSYSEQNKQKKNEKESKIESEKLGKNTNQKKNNARCAENNENAQNLHHEHKCNDYEFLKKLKSIINDVKALEEFEKAEKNAETSEKKTYLRRSLEKIDKLEEHFFLVNETGSIVAYSKNGMIVNNAITISPEAYNQIGDQFLQRRLEEIKLLPTEKERNEAIEQLDYDEKEFKKLAKKFVNNKLTKDEKIEFEKKKAEMPRYRKTQLFKKSKKYQNLANYREEMKKIEVIMSDGKNLEEWQQTKIDIENDLKSGKITQEESQKEMTKVNKNIIEAKIIRSIIQSFDSIINDRSSQDVKITLQKLEQIIGNGKTAKEWKNQENELTKKIDDMKNGKCGNFINNEATQNAIRNKQKKLIEAILQQKRLEKLNSVWKDKNFRKMIKNSLKMIQNMDTFTIPESEGFITDIQFDAVKTKIEHFFGVTDYRQAQVNGQRIFENLSLGDADQLYREIKKMSFNPAKAEKYFEIGCKMIADADCHLEAKCPRQFTNVLEIVEQNVAIRHTIENLPEEQLKNEDVFLNDILNGDSMAYKTMRTNINQMYDVVASAPYQEHQVRMATVEAAVAYVMKHRTDWGDQTNQLDCLTTRADEIFNESHKIGETYSQDGQSKNIFYGAHLHRRYMFGIQVANDEPKRFSTIYSKGDVPTPPLKAEISDNIAVGSSWVNKYFYRPSEDDGSST